ncbi:MAG: DNA polymerase III subunit alpha [Candidatus Kerfeldbacteria bacterium]|nr:DNA polymerase III subunit alpha [Candidatus Kerfeldbacteria bacterium]
MRFVNLHTHSHYSLLDGLPTIESLVSYAKQLGMTGLALTDHGVLYGAVEFFQRATAAGLKPIIGVEAYFTRGSRFDRTGHADDRPNHLILLAQNAEGYRHLIKLVTASHLEGFYGKPRIDLELLEQHHRGLICLSGCLNGPIPSLLASGNQSEAEAMAKSFRDLFGPENFALELQDRPSIPAQAAVNRQLAAVGAKLGIPLVATNDSHYLHADDAEAQDVLLCIHLKKLLDDTDRLSMRDQDLSLLPGEAMAEKFAAFPGAVEHSATLAQTVDFSFEFGKTILPHFEVPNKRAPIDYLRTLVTAVLPKRYAADRLPTAAQRLEYELEVIGKTGFAPFFLIVADFVNWAKDHGIVVGPGRGSAAGSIVSYLLNITSVDPIQYELLFERFLNPDRVVMPDFDIDFADTRRDEVIRYVQQKYGPDHVAGIITFGTMAARAAIRDVGRVLGLPYAYCDRVAKLIPMFATLNQAIRSVPELREIYDQDPTGRRLLDTAKKLVGVARHASQHACGFVISKEPLVNAIPVQRASSESEMLVTQYSLHPIEDLGILKIDFLGLSNLTIIETARAIIQATRRIDVDLDGLPLDDPATYQLLQRGATTGVFQLESSGMRRYLRDLKPTTLEDIVAMVALYRPGPMELIPQFIAGKHGQYKPSYLDPRLKPILEKTYGVAVYQEQVMQMARDLAGFTMAEADVLRKAVGKKIAKLLKEQREKFISGAVANHIKKSTAEKIFEFIEPFARYGFNRAHAVCYGLIAYQTAFLKANYPAEFMAALLTADQANTDRVAIEVNECRQMSLEVLAPDLNESFASFAVVPNSDGTPPTRIRFGLSAVKNVGDNLVTAVIAERKTSGPFASLEDFLRRVQSKDLNRKSLESLIKAGALDRFGERRQMLEHVAELLTINRGAEREAERKQLNLFGTMPVNHAPVVRLRQVAPANDDERLAWEKQLLGFYVSAHPLDAYIAALAGLTITSCNKLSDLRRSQRASVAGVITSIQRVMTRTAESMLFVRLEDQSGSVEVLVFPSVLKADPGPWQEDKVVVVAGKVSDKDGVAKLLADNARELTKETTSVGPVADTVVVTIPNAADEQLWLTLKDIFRRHPGPAKVVLAVRGEQRRIVTSYLVDRHDEFVRAIESLLGQGAIAETG